MTDTEARFANYNGDQSHIIYDNPKGPDTRGRFWRAVDADYDETVNRTRVTFAQVSA